MFRICKAVTVESGHMLTKSSGRCRFPHGHSRRIEFVLASPTLDENDMVCDFNWVELAVKDFVDQFDHALCLNAKDPLLDTLDPQRRRVVVFQEGDPTTELIAKRIFDHLQAQINAATPFTTSEGVTHRIRPEVRLRHIRVAETPTSWAEHTAES